MSRYRTLRRTAAACSGLLLAVLLSPALGQVPASAADAPRLVASDGETTPTSHAGDSMDDPAIWVHPTEPSRSLLIGNDKAGALETYDLDGSVVQRLGVGDSWGNVDVRQELRIGAFSGDLVAAVSNGVRLYGVDRATRLLSQVNQGTPVRGLGEGLCLYQSRSTQKVYGISITIQGVLTQYEILDSNGDGLLESNTVRTFAVGSEAEGCVADDDTGALYISEEDQALWRYSAEPDGGTTREAVDVLTSAGGHLAQDVEGVTLVDQADGGGFVIVSAQNVANPTSSYFSVYERGPGNDFVDTFRISDGASSDDCDRTDGITASTANLGPRFPSGMFVCQDDDNDLPGTSGNQNLKMVRLEKVVSLDGGPPPPPPPPPDPSPVQFVDQAVTNTHGTSFSVRIPSTTEAGDTLLLFASYAAVGTLSTPGPGWTQVGEVTDDGHATTVWSRTATAADAGTPVRLTNAGTYTKMALSVAAYRGAEPASPVQAIDGAGEPGAGSAHTTPRVPNQTTGAWRISYWSDKSSATTRWASPDGETVRGASAGTGSGRITSLLTDAGSPLTAGTPSTTGGLVATADASSRAATTWTILLRPAGEEAPPSNVPPTARFTSSCDGLVCSFDGTTSSDPEDSIKGYEWDFGDGGSASGATPGHTFAGPGTYEVRLRVTDDTGATDSVQHPVVVGTAAARIAFVDRASSNAHNVTFTVTVPGSVQAGDALLLFASQSTTGALTGPGDGWTQIGRVMDNTHATTVWSKVATASDAGATVRLGSGTTYTKVATTVAAYRGVDQVAPVASVTGAGEPGTTTSHATPIVANSTPGAWRVSYWSDKSSASTGWAAPAGEAVRARTAGEGGGRIGSLLTDADSPLRAGSPATTGGLVAVSDASSAAATMWTVLLRPAD